MDQSHSETSGASGEAEGGDDQEDSSSSSSKGSGTLEEFRNEWKREIESSPVHLSKPEEELASPSEQVPRTVLDKAAFYFKLGIDYEEKGKMYEAIQHYKRAVQLYPDIEYHLFQSQPKYPIAVPVEEDDDKTYEVSYEVEGEEEEDEFDPETMDLLTHLHILSLRQHRKVACHPQLPTNTTHISALPLEVFQYILRWVVSADLDMASLEMCSRVCRSFYISCRDQELWRAACMRVWGVKCGGLTSVYGSWRDMFIRRPRLHFGGCYISKISYIRHGENSFQDQFYRPWHLVEYYRYLRFFSDGRVLMLMTPEEPASCVGLLRRRLPPARKAPILTGYYRILDTVVSIVLSQNDRDLKVTKSNSNFSYSITYHMELEIDSRKKLLHGRLVWREYSVFTSRNGVETNSPFGLISSRFPPFYYSRVKSYTSEATQPLHYS